MKHHSTIIRNGLSSRSLGGRAIECVLVWEGWFQNDRIGAVGPFAYRFLTGVSTL
jgi:hypothetical protein